MINFVKKYMGILLIFSIIIGYFFPILGGLKPIIMPALMLLLFCSFLSLKLSFKNVFRKELLIYPLFNWIVLPISLVLLKPYFTDDLFFGIFLALITPPALGSPIIVSFVGGDLSFCLANVTIYNLLAPITYIGLPLIYFSSFIKFDILFLFVRVLLFIVIPLMLSLIVRKFPKIKEFSFRKVDPLKGIIQLVMISISVASASIKMRELGHLELVKLLLTTTILAGILYLTGFLFRGKENLRQTLPITTGHKNTLMSLMIAITNFSPLTALPIISYLISHHICNGVILFVFRKHNN